MAEQNHGFRKFIMDPKSSVMTYLAENIPQERPSQPHAGALAAQNSPHQTQQLVNQNPAQYQSGQHLDSAQHYNEDPNMPLRPVDHLQPAGSISQHNTPQPAYVHPTQNVSTSSNWIVNPAAEPVQVQPVNVNGTISNGHFVPYPETPLGYQVAGYEQAIESNAGPAQSQNHIPTQAKLQQPQYTLGQNNRQSPTSRLYYRTLLEFETTKFTFLLAKTGDRAQDTILAAYKLESLSRRLFTLRSENLQDFEGFTEVGHIHETSRLQAEYQLWAATVLDIQESPNSSSSSSNGLGAINHMDSRPQDQNPLTGYGTNPNLQAQPHYESINGPILATNSPAPTQNQLVQSFQNATLGPSASNNLDIPGYQTQPSISTPQQMQTQQMQPQQTQPQQMQPQQMRPQQISQPQQMQQQPQQQQQPPISQPQQIQPQQIQPQLQQQQQQQQQSRPTTPAFAPSPNPPLPQQRPLAQQSPGPLPPSNGPAPPGFVPGPGMPLRRG